MLSTPNIKSIYKKIQTKLFYMIPEKWDKIYLYASVIDGLNHLETGEMFFYYFPKGILKKNPINVYEVPNKFNLEETAYFKLADELYALIKELRKEFVLNNEKLWSNITISIENFQFIVEYGYEDLINSSYSSYDRHIIWRYKYLKTGLNTYNKKERDIILEYLKNTQYVKERVETYRESIYNKTTHNIVEYNKLDTIKNAEDKAKKSKEKKNQILNF